MLPEIAGGYWLLLCVIGYWSEVTALKIENQAMIFALLSKYTILAEGEAGRAAIREGMRQYGKERGMRMAARAEANGDPCALWTEQAYGEWKPDYQGQMEFGTVHTEPTLVTYISKCAWCDAWKKYDILEYGREYCVDVDAAVYEGFGCGAVCTPITTAMSWGGDCCQFDWGLPLSAEDQQKMADKKAELGTSAMKDFEYHTAHIFSTVSGAVRKAFPDDADSIIEQAVRDYIAIFGQEEYEVLLKYSPEDFRRI